MGRAKRSQGKKPERVLASAADGDSEEEEVFELGVDEDEVRHAITCCALLLLSMK